MAGSSSAAHQYRIQRVLLSGGAEFQIGDAANVDTSKLRDVFNRKGVPTASSSSRMPIANDTDGILNDSDLPLQGTVELGGVNCEEEEQEAWREELYQTKSTKCQDKPTIEWLRS